MSKQTELVGLARTTNLDEVNAAYSAGALSNRNLIINGAMQVSQRGSFTTATSINSGAYYLDRFKTVLAGSTATITHKTNQVLPSGEYVNTLLQTLAGGGYTGTQQFVEDFNRLKGQTVTLSAWVKSNVTSSMSIYDGVSQPSTGHTGGGQWEKLTLTHTCPTNITQMRTEVWTSTGRVSGDYFEVAQFQLEVGDTATPFEHRSSAQELALCRRYARLIGDGLTGNGVTASTWGASYVADPPMRASPTAYLTQTSIRISDHFYSDYNSSGSAMAFSNLSADGGRIGINGFSGMTTARWMSAWGNTNGTFVLLDAEL
jgi:hypothetical protein